ncbi:MAG: uL15 family ribosomal protein [archaeon]
MNKRSKRSRIRGGRSSGHGHKSKPRGKGSTGGKGMAGTGKKAGQKRLWLLRYFPNYLGKHGFTSRRKKLKEMNLEDIEKQKEALKEGIYNLPKYKVLSRGNISKGVKVKAYSFSKKAKEKIEKAGGEAIQAN